MVDLADVTGLDDQPDLGARLLADQVVVDSGGEQQRRIGARSAFEWWSDSTMMRAPSAMARDTSPQISSSRVASASPPPVRS